MPNSHWSSRRCARRGTRRAQRVVRAVALRDRRRGARARRALVEGHDDVGAELAPGSPSTAPGRARCGAAVDVALEARPFLVETPQGGQAEDLVAAAVGQERPVPAHEAVQAAEGGHEVVARAQHEVVGVGEEDRRPDLPQIRGAARP